MVFHDTLQIHLCPVRELFQSTACIDGIGRLQYPSCAGFFLKETSPFEDRQDCVIALDTHLGSSCSADGQVIASLPAKTGQLASVCFPFLEDVVQGVDFWFQAGRGQLSLGDIPV